MHCPACPLPEESQRANARNARCHFLNARAAHGHKWARPKSKMRRSLVVFQHDGFILNCRYNLTCSSLPKCYKQHLKIVNFWVQPVILKAFDLSISLAVLYNLCNKAKKYRVKRWHHHILICPFSAHCPIVNARARNILSWKCLRPPVPETSMPGCARAKKLCPLNITKSDKNLVFDQGTVGKNDNFWLIKNPKKI